MNYADLPSNCGNFSEHLFINWIRWNCWNSVWYVWRRWGFFNDSLLFFIGIPPAVAVASEANQILGASFSGAIAHFRRKNVDIKMGFLLILGGIIGSIFGVELFRIFKNLGQLELIIKVCYVLFLGIIGIIMFLKV